MLNSWVTMIIRLKELKDRKTPQVNFFQYWASKVVPGTGKEGKTKEVVKDREGKTVVCDKVECERRCVTKQEGMWKDSMRVRMYVCMYVCINVMQCSVV